MKNFMKLLLGIIISTISAVCPVNAIGKEKSPVVAVKPAKLTVGLSASAPKAVTPVKAVSRTPREPDTNDGRKAFTELLSSLKKFNYNSKAISIPLPMVEQDVVISCKNESLGGSGNIFMPLPEIVIEIKNRTSKSDVTLKDAIAALAKNEICKYSVQFPLLQWLSQTKATPANALIVKMLVLLICKLQSKQTPPVKQEIARLLVRLSLSENSGMFKNKQLSTFIPKEIKDFIKIFCPTINSRAVIDQAFEFMDTFWMLLTHNADSVQISKANARGNVYCFIFKDAAFAQQCSTHFATYDKSSDIVPLVEKYAGANGYQVIDDKKEFDSYDHIPKTTDGTYDPAAKLIGFRSLGALSSAATAKDIPTEVATTIAFTKDLNTAINVSTTNGKHWVVFVTSSFGKMDALSLSILAVAKSFKQYAQAKKTLIEQNEEVRTATQQQEQHNARIREFLKSEEGKNAIITIENGIDAILKENAPVPNAALIKLKKEIEDLQEQVLTKKEFVKTLMSKPARNETYRKTQQARIDKLNTEITTLGETIAQKQINLATLENNLKKHKEDVLKAKKELEALQQESGDAYLVDSEFTETEPTEDRESLDQILNKREKVAELYQEVARNLQKEVVQKQTELAAEGKSEIVQKIAVAKYSAFISELNKAASTLTQENEEVRDLMECKELVRLGETATEITTRIPELEAKVGHILTAKKAQDVIKSVRETYANEFVVFVKDLNGNVKEFKQIRDELISTLKWITQNTEHIRSNAPMYQYLLNCFKWYLPEMMPLVSQV